MSIITETLGSFDYPNLEFIVSDRHHRDDAIEGLQSAFAGDPRFRFLVANDELNWVQHYNLLLREAAGEYFFWVSHDDSYSPDYISKLVEALEKNPDAILAYGRVVRLDINDERLTYTSPRIPDSANAPGVLTAYRCVTSACLQFHGVFRRQFLLARQLWIRPTIENIAADMLWLFAVALIGRTIYVDDCIFSKRYYPSSTHKRWDSLMRPNYLWNFARVTCSYLDDYAPGWVERVMGKCIAYLACSMWMFRLALRPWVRRISPGLYNPPRTDA